ncbi:MAG TPA: hypothetical protein VL426_00820 [Candidatus Binatia bacterium]|nr:hypothetical protein [Candidatus Binatia bacterium]
MAYFATAEHDLRLQKLSELLFPHVTAVIGEEAGRRILPLPISRLGDVALHAPCHGNIIERALKGESRLMVLEWTMLLQEAAHDRGSVLELASLDDAMLPPLADDLRRIFEESCARRIAGMTMTRAILGRVRASLPAGERLPVAILEILRHGRIEVV